MKYSGWFHWFEVPVLCSYAGLRQVSIVSIFAGLIRIQLF
jgi:hypothetical protein